MGKAALLIITALIIAGSYYNLARSDGQAATVRAVSEHQYGILARTAALSGYEQARQAVADAGSFKPFAHGGIGFDGTYGDGTYRATISSDGETASIRSVGTAGPQTNAVAFTVDAVIGHADAPAESVPPFMSYALLSEEDVILNGNMNAYVDDPSSQHNANLHTNGNLHVSGNAAEVAGFGSYVGSGTSSPSSALSSTFQPNVNPDLLETTFQTSAVDIPTFDADEFLQHVEVDQRTDGDARLTGPVFLGGTEDDPYVWHVTGDLTATGRSTILGYVMFVVEGDADLSGHLAAGEINDESTTAIYAGGDVRITGSIEIHGQIYAEGDVTFSGTPDVYGSVTTHAAAVLNGTPAIHYRPASAALTTIFSDATAMKVISYYEH